MRKVVRPSKEQLENLVMEIPLTKIGRQFGVSDNAVRKWCKSYGIENLPNNSYRQRVFHNKK
jgi:transposase-like protein